METAEAARRWSDTWRRAWPAGDMEAIAALYAENTAYRALAFREPDLGLAGARRYLSENFDAEDQLECWFSEPVVDGERAAVEWWGTWIEGGKRLTLAGATLLRFTAEGLVADHRDYWNQADRLERPYPGW